MRFESFMWTLLALFLAVGSAWKETESVQPLDTEEKLEAADGGNTIPPGP